MEITGACPAAFSAVEDAFAQNFEDGNELGAAFSVYIDGQLIIDIKGGYTDKKKTVPWSDQSLVSIYSSGKAAVAFLIAKAVSDGHLDYDAPIARLWPEFGANGKENITLAQALSHQGGLCGFPEPMQPSVWLDWDQICARIAGMKPLWEPGTQSGYHPQNFGFIAGEIYRRATGESVSSALRQYDLGVYCGLEQEEMAHTVYMAKANRPPNLGEITPLKQIAFLKPWSSTGPGTGEVSREQWMAAQIPASNMHGHSQGLAQLLHPIANQGRDSKGVKVLSDETLSQLYRERCHGDDLILPFTLSWAAGVMRNANRHFGPNQNALGHAGFGGSAVVMDQDHHMTIAYVMNKMSPHLVGDPRSLNLIQAVYGSL